MRSALGLFGQTNLIAMHVIMVGHMSGGSHPPVIPTISGPSSGKSGILYNYSVRTMDSNGDDVFYFIDWGDGTNSGWIGAYKSGEEIVVAHNWNEKGTYSIRVKAKDVFNAQSGWAALTVTMPLLWNKPISPFFYMLFQRFPHAFLILQHLMGY